MKLSAVVLLFACALFTPTSFAASPSSPSSSSCCLCEHCEDVPEENAAAFTVSPFGKPEGTTCGELSLELLDLMDDSDKCLSIQQDYRTGCCAPMEEEKESFLSGARRLWTNALSWTPASGSWNRSSSRSNASQRPVASTWSGTVGGSRTSSRTSSFRTGGSRTSGSTTSRYGGGSTSRVSSGRYGGSVASSTSSSGGATDCTYEPVGVRFNTKGGNAPFEICEDGQDPEGIAGATIMDPHQKEKFSGTCKALNQLAKNGEMSNNLCRIARIRLDPLCCSNPEHTTSSLRTSWSFHRGNTLRGGN